MRKRQTHNMKKKCNKKRHIVSLILSVFLLALYIADCVITTIFDNHENPLIDRKGQIAGYLNGTPNCVDKKTIDIYGWCHIKPCPKDGKYISRNLLRKTFATKYYRSLKCKTGGYRSVETKMLRF